MNDERLRQILRQGDPAEEDGGLTPDEARAMRRTVLTAVPERKRRLSPVLALAGAAATAVMIAAVLSRPAPVPPRVATVTAPSTPPIAQIPVEPVPQLPPRGEERRPVQGRHHQQQHHHRRPVIRATPAIDATLASLEAPEAERQIQFSTPGGTRIIWILKSGKASR